MGESEHSTITIRPYKDRPLQEIRVPFSEEEIGIIESLHKGLDTLRKAEATDVSGPIRHLEHILVFIEGLSLQNRGETLESLKEGRQWLDKAIEITEEDGFYRSSFSTLLKMREDFGKILPDEAEE